MRADGFDKMDIATDIAYDPKFRYLARIHPELVAPCFLVYISLLGESWQQADRVTAEDAWPLVLAFDREVLSALEEVRLIGEDGKVPQATWDSWFTAVQIRRDAHRERERQRRARSVPPTSGQRDTSGRSPSVPSVRPSSPSVPSDTSVRPSRGRGALERISFPPFTASTDKP